MPEMKDIFNFIHKAADKLNKVSTVTTDIESIGNSYSKRKKLKESGELERIKQEIEVYDRKSTKLLKCCIGVWGILLIATIILCITGNDVVLKLLHI